MNSSGHREYIRRVPGAKTAVLCIHGIIGSPRHFTGLIPLIPGNVTVYNILLPGHGGTAEDFARSSMRDWELYVAKLANRLCGEYENLIIAGHSMGTLFAVDAALANPERVKGLFLMNVPLTPRPKLDAVLNSVGVLWDVTSPNPVISASKASYSITPDKRLWKYLAWLPRYGELFKKAAQTRQRLPLLRVPGVAFVSGRDELVSPLTYPLLRRTGTVKTVWLPGSRHYYYTKEDRARIKAEFSAMLAPFC